MKRLLALGVMLTIAGATAYGNEDRGQVYLTGKIKTRDAHALLWLPDGRLLLGHHDGVQVSSDRGTTWRALLDKPNFDAMNLQRAAKTFVLAGHDVYATSTDGKTWKDQTYKGIGGTDLHSYAVNPQNTKLHYAWEARSGLHASRDGGRTWKAVTPQNLPPDIIKLAASKDAVYAVSARTGLWRSTDGARTFTAVQTPEANVYTVEVAPDGSVWLGGKSGVWRQKDSAWSNVADDSAFLIAVNPKRPGEAVWVDTQGKILRNTR